MNESCKICSLEISHSELIFDSPHWRVRHSEETKIPGYCILESKRHFLDLSYAAPEELADYGLILSALMKVQHQVLKIERIYTFSLAEAVPHYHLHVIPRAAEFPRAFKGRGIMSYPTLPSLDLSLKASMISRMKIELKRVMPELSGA
ncbi:MAG: HIT domain-containing protein [Candidatus Obscuribacterales bacterium]|nr:HIT domain-containing protein [Candidatus Obscuribacterales bacterium]